MIKSKLKVILSRDKGQKGIWQFSSYLSSLPDFCKLSLGEGGTREILFREELVFKREDENPTGSVKDRGMAFLVSQALACGKKDLVLSSSGNAAIAAAEYCNLAKINLFVFVSPKIDPLKLERLKKKEVKIFISPRAVSEAIKFSQENGYFNLRPSTNEFGAEGYQTIAFELAESQGVVEDVFIPVSSGTVLLGVANGFRKIGLMPRLHACQSAAVCPIASYFRKDFQPEKTSLATALVAKYTPLRQQIISLIKESGGTGWVINNQEIIESQKDLEKEGIITSAEGALVYAAWKKAKNSFSLGKAVCLLTGKKYS